MNRINGLYIPLLTPAYFGSIDEISLISLMSTAEPFVDGYVPCLSSGEGQKLTIDEWKQVVDIVRKNTTKPIYCGIKHESMSDILLLATYAKEIGCEGIVLPVPSFEGEALKQYFETLFEKVDINCIVYNTELYPITDMDTVLLLDSIPNIVAIKESSSNPVFFKELCDLKQSNDIKISVLQGMEHQLDYIEHCDGLLLSLLNTEPELLHTYFKTLDETLKKKIYRLFYEQNLGGEWYISLKAIMKERGIFRSAEEIHPFVVFNQSLIDSIIN